MIIYRNVINSLLLILSTGEKKQQQQTKNKELLMQLEQMKLNYFVFKVLLMRCETSLTG